MRCAAPSDPKARAPARHCDPFAAVTPRGVTELSRGSSEANTPGLRPREEKGESGEERFWVGAGGDVGADRWRGRTWSTAPSAVFPCGVRPRPIHKPAFPHNTATPSHSSTPRGVTEISRGSSEANTPGSLSPITDRHPEGVRESAICEQEDVSVRLHREARGEQGDPDPRTKTQVARTRRKRTSTNDQIRTGVTWTNTSENRFHERRPKSGVRRRPPSSHAVCGPIQSQSPGSRAVDLLVPQCLDRVELAGSTGGVEAEEDSHAGGEDKGHDRRGNRDDGRPLGAGGE